MLADPPEFKQAPNTKWSSESPSALPNISPEPPCSVGPKAICPGTLGFVLDP